METEREQREQAEENAEQVEDQDAGPAFDPEQVELDDQRDQAEG
jgi:hypothetical protein